MLMNNTLLSRLFWALILFCLLAPASQAQSAGDTVVVPTFSFSDPAPASVYRGSFKFPDASERFQKVLMAYTLKCDPSTRADGFACGEWDYLTYTFLTDSSGVFDSTRRSIPNYQLLSGNAPDSIHMVTSPTYTYYHDWQKYMTFPSVGTRDSAILGTGGQNSLETLHSQFTSGKSQYLWRVAELSSAGLSAGDISALRLNLSALGTELENLHVRLKHSALDSLAADNYETDGFQTVYRRNTHFAQTGWASLNFLQPFTWDGTSNIVVEFSYTNNAAGADNEVKSDIMTWNSGVHTAGNEHFLDFEGPDIVSVPADHFQTLSTEVTVSLWQYGDTARQPQSDYAFEGYNANNQRVLNSHLPWGNGQVYWDAGQEGNGYDRIFTSFQPQDYEGQWNHWAFTKNTATGEMKMYLNGQLVHSGTGKTRLMSGITRFNIGSRVPNAGGAYDGYIDEFRVWDKELDQATIQAWMAKDITPSHPDYANLIAYYQFNEGSGLVANSGMNQAKLWGTPAWNRMAGKDLFRNMTVTTNRPQVIFDQSNYATMIDSVLIVDSIMNPPQHVVLYNNPSGPYVIRHDEPNQPDTPTDTLTYWNGNTYSYTYGTDGSKIDSTWIASGNVLRRNDKVWYNNIVRYEIGRYITPYGINLDLGPEGTMWVFDVTDYAPLLHDWVYLQAGNNQELLDLKFLMIKGEPARDVKRIQKIYDGSWSFASFVNGTRATPQTFRLDPAASMYRVKTRTTGHGFGGGAGTNCSEFCRREHSVWLNGNETFKWWLWNECAKNPVQPQGGTWIFDRAGWCPGDAVQTYDHELTDLVSPGDTVELDYEVDPLGQQPEGNWVLRAQLVSYGPPNHKLDLAVEDVLAPTTTDIHGHFNPICDNPIVKISNRGTDTLTSCIITYGVKNGFKPCYYRWEGKLGFLEEETVTLPLFNWTGAHIPAQPTFYADVSYPNYTTDGYDRNNYIEVPFDLPPQYPTNFVIELKTNNRANENRWYIEDDMGNVVKRKDFLVNNTTYNDPIDLPDGCYTFVLPDVGEDGLDFFFNRATAGTGFIRFLAPSGGNIIRRFDPDFGAEIRHQFTIGYNLGEEFYDIPCSDFTSIDAPEIEALPISIYPNPAQNRFFVETEFEQAQATEIVVYDMMGKEVYRKDFGQVEAAQLSIELPEAKGVYVVRVQAGSEMYSKSILLR